MSLLVPAGSRRILGSARGRTGMVEEIIEEAVELVARVAALDIGKASLVACVRVPHETRAGARRQGVPRIRHDNRFTAGVAGLAGGPGGGLVRDGGHLDVLEAAVLPAGRRDRVLGGECPRCEECARPPEDRPAGCGLAGQAGRAGDAAPVVRPAGLAAGTAGSVPVPAHPDPRAHPGETARGETAGRHPDQAVGGDQRHFRGVGAGHAGGADRRAARTHTCWPGWPAGPCARRSASCRRR